MSSAYCPDSFLACPLMHLFMHYGHHGGHGQRRSNPDNEGEQGR